MSHDLLPEAESNKAQTLEGTLFLRKKRNFANGITAWKLRYVVLHLEDGGSLNVYTSHPTFGEFKFNGNDSWRKSKKTASRVVRSVLNKKGNKKDLSSLHRPQSSFPEKMSQAQIESLRRELDVVAEDPKGKAVKSQSSPNLGQHVTTSGVLDVPPTLYIPADVPWIMNDVDSADMFRIEIPPERKIDDKEMGDVDDASTSTFSSYQGKKAQLFFFRCPGKGNEKDLWLRAGKKLNRFSAELISNAGKKIIAPVDKAIVTKSRIRDEATSNFEARARMLEHHLSVSNFKDDEHQLELPSQSSSKSLGEKEFKVFPASAYPYRWMTYSELHNEMLRKSSHFHDLRTSPGDFGEIGTVTVEVLSCIGLPKLDRFSKTDAICYLVCGSYAFSTDIIPDTFNPMWPRKSRRACIMPLYHAYARLFVGVFDDDGPNENDDFAGRVVVDLPRLRPGSTYDVTLPLRWSSHVYSRKTRGSVRLRFRVDWNNERAAVLSYLSKDALSKKKSGKGTATAPACTVSCEDFKSFRNIALTVHGANLPGRFSQKIFKSTLREVKLYRLAILALLKQTVKDTVMWQNPAISMFVFIGWMNCVSANSVALVPAYFTGYLFIVSARNYARYNINAKSNRGFLPLTFEELLASLLLGGPNSSKHYMKPLEMKRSESSIMTARESLFTDSLSIGGLSTEESSVTTHNPYGQSLFKSIGFSQGDCMMSEAMTSDDHMEFPFSSREKYPRLSVKESIAVNEEPLSILKRIPKVRNSMESRDKEKESTGFNDDDDDDDDVLEEKTEANAQGQGEEGSHQHGQAEAVASNECLEINEDQERIFEKLPEQNIDIRVAAKKKIQEELVEFRHKFQEMTMRTFDDRAYVKPADTDEKCDDGVLANPLNRLSCFTVKESPSAAQDKVLGVNAHANPVVAKTAIFLGPIVSMMQLGLSITRALFNAFMWKDPYLSFWMSLFLLLFTFVFALFPWRLFMFLLGVIAVGPQNWAIRLLKRAFKAEKGKWPHGDEGELETEKHEKLLPNESASDKSKRGNVGIGKSAPGNFLKLGRQLKNDNPGNSGGAAPSAQPSFCYGQNDNDGKNQDLSEATKMHHVVVPYSRLRCSRFYDWPPEPEFARVSANPNKARAGNNSEESIPPKEKRTPISSVASHDTEKKELSVSFYDVGKEKKV